MKTDDNRCRECGTKLIGKNAIEVGYCIPCFAMMMADPDDDEGEKYNKKYIPSHWPVRSDEDDF
jgi:hypothetical protein